MFNKDKKKTLFLTFSWFNYKSHKLKFYIKPLHNIIYARIKAQQRLYHSKINYLPALPRSIVVLLLNKLYSICCSGFFLSRVEQTTNFSIRDLSKIALNKKFLK